jgi:hypothetical protein
MFVINPDPFNLPAFRIGPFTTKDLTINHHIFSDSDTNLNGLDTYFESRFGEDYYFTVNGREAINLALSSYNLKKSDLVTIITTSQNYYISSCVTKEIEKYCLWNREIVQETKLILVNHEFGFIYPYMDNIVSLGLPIIEDCCTTFFSQSENGKVGKYGDFAVYSFPKFFPIQIGGLLSRNADNAINKKSSIDKATEKYVKKVIAYYIDKKDEILNKRRQIYGYAVDRFKSIGFTVRFVTDSFTVPSALMLKNNMIIEDLPALKIHMWAHGVQSSIFYGEDAFFIPNHQNLVKSDVDYFVFIIQSFINNQ